MQSADRAGRSGADLNSGQKRAIHGRAGQRRAAARIP